MDNPNRSQKTSPPANFKWWERGIIYHIYPRSFMDSNGDGIGDLVGIRSKLDYLEWLGVDAIWISPIYPSPMTDFGYDISNYMDIDSSFGSLADFEALLADAHRRGLKVLLDYVPNHTSDQHPWFLESRASRNSAKRNWYIWRNPKPWGGPPNNWLSNFGGAAWTWDEKTGQYYYHAFLREQPDLNWRNPEVQLAMLQVLRFWLDRGVDGFRVDVMHHLVKDEEFRDNPPNSELAAGDVTLPGVANDLYGGPSRGARDRGTTPQRDRRIRRSHVGGRDLPACGTAHGLLWRQRQGSAPTV
jgi:alpha-glucosidase